MCLSPLSEVLAIWFSDLQISLLITTLNRLTSLFFSRREAPEEGRRDPGEIHIHMTCSSILYPNGLTMGSILCGLTCLWLHQEPALLPKNTHKHSTAGRTCQWLPGRRLFCQGMWEERSRVTSHKQVDGCNALVTAVDITTAIGACIPVSGLGNTESADGVVTEYIFFGIPCNFRLS